MKINTSWAVVVVVVVKWSACSPSTSMNPSSNPARDYIFYDKIDVEKDENKQKEAG